MAQICTTKEQSERLLALGISDYTADMTLQEYINPETEDKEVVEIVGYGMDGTPAWSLGALFKLLPGYVDTYELFRIEIRHEEIVYLNVGSLLHITEGEDIFENCINMIEFLVKNGHIKTDNQVGNSKDEKGFCMKQFDRGWWNCFLTFASEVLDCGEYGSEELLVRVLDGAAVSDAEIKFVLKSDFTHNDHVLDFLRSHNS